MMHDNRSDALEAGDKCYNNCKPCINGHYGTRYAASCQCVQCSKLSARRNYEKMIGRKVATVFPRKTAKANGDKYYKSGKDCKHGHTNPLRQTKDAYCTECHSVARPTKRKYKTKNKQYIGRTGSSFVITAKEKKDDDFKEMVKRVYARNQRW